MNKCDTYDHRILEHLIQTIDTEMHAEKLNFIAISVGSGMDRRYFDTSS